MLSAIKVTASTLVFTSQPTEIHLSALNASPVLCSKRNTSSNSPSHSLTRRQILDNLLYKENISKTGHTDSDKHVRHTVATMRLFLPDLEPGLVPKQR